MGTLSISRLEELSLNAWPARHTLLYDGWLLRVSEGYTRRANSIQPLYPGTLPLADKVPACEALYARHGLPVIFKLTPAAAPPELDAYLAARGYQEDARTSVQVLDLAECGLLPAAPDPPSDRPDPEWLAAFAAMSRLDARRSEALTRIVSSILPAAGFFARRAGAQIVACGLGVVEAGHVGVFDIVTHPEHRGHGHARGLLLDLLAWARAAGAHTAYLQVMLDNAPALRLYASLGFHEAYPYWYRVRAAP